MKEAKESQKDRDCEGESSADGCDNTAEGDGASVGVAMRTPNQP